MAGNEMFINGAHYTFETASNPLGWVFVAYWDGPNRRRVLVSDFKNPERLKGREDVRVNPHDVVLFRNRRLAEHFIQTKGD